MSLIIPPSQVLPASYISGNFYYPPGITLAAGSVIAANVIRLIPLIIPAPVVITSMGIRVTTAQASGNAQLAIYANNTATGRPTGNALASTGNLSTTTGTAVSASLSGGNTAFAPAVYWVGINNDSTAGGTAIYQTQSSGVPWMGYLMGSATELNLANGSTAAGMNLSVAQTYNTWPDLTSASFTENTGTASAMLHFKVA